MATLGTFRTAVAAKLGLQNDPAGDQPIIDIWVNEGVSEILTRSRINVVPGTMALTSGSFDYTLPTQILALDEMYVTPVGSTQPYLMYRKSPAEIVQLRVGATGGTPPTRFYALSGTTLLMVYPTPTVADVLTLYYVPRPATLTAPGDTPSDIPLEWHKAVEYYACWQAGQLTDSSTTQEGNLYRQLYEDELKAMKRAAIHRGGRKLSRAVVGKGASRKMAGSPSQQGV